MSEDGFDVCVGHTIEHFYLCDWKNISLRQTLGNEMGEAFNSVTCQQYPIANMRSLELSATRTYNNPVSGTHLTRKRPKLRLVSDIGLKQIIAETSHSTERKSLLTNMRGPRCSQPTSYHKHLSGPGWRRGSARSSCDKGAALGRSTRSSPLDLALANIQMKCWLRLTIDLIHDDQTSAFIATSRYWKSCSIEIWSTSGGKSVTVEH